MEVKPLNPYTHQLQQPSFCSWEQHPSYILPTSSATPRQNSFVQLTTSSRDDPDKGTLLFGVGHKKYSTSQVKNKENFQAT